MAEEKSERWYAVLGLAIIIGCVAALFFFGRFIFQKLYPSSPVQVSLSAYFVDDKGNFVAPTSDDYPASHLKITGSVSRGGKPVAGVARVAIANGEGKQDYFGQSVSLPLDDKGQFATDDPAFRSVRPGQAVDISVDVTGDGLSATSSMVLNSRPLADRTTWVVGINGAFLVLAIVFCWAFTGRKTAAKNQTAIIFSYIVIAIFLGVPILAPDVLLRLFPESVNGMIGAPAGLINTHTPNQDKGETQWALNIGGYSFEAPATQAPAPTTTPSPTVPVAPTTPTTPPATGGTTPATSGTAPATPAASNDSTAAAVKTTSATTPAAATSPGRAKVPGDPPGPTTIVPTTTGGQNAPVVAVQGGLVIPLYVIILSVIGGAINMTRKVPRFQQEGEESDFNLTRPISRFGEAMVSPFRVQIQSLTQPQATAQEQPQQAEQTQASADDQAKAIQDALEPLVKDQVLRNCETDATLKQMRNLVARMQDLYRNNKADTLLGFGSFEDWAASQPRINQLLRGSWRSELLNQYMYLISAPFLAIVTYYILDLLGLSKQGVVVVLSFSVGLVSEKIVTWILGIATGYLRTDTSGTTPAKA